MKKNLSRSHKSVETFCANGIVGYSRILPINRRINHIRSIHRLDLQDFSLKQKRSTFRNKNDLIIRKLFLKIQANLKTLLILKRKLRKAVHFRRNILDILNRKDSTIALNITFSKKLIIGARFNIFTYLSCHIPLSSFKIVELFNDCHRNDKMVTSFAKSQIGFFTTKKCTSAKNKLLCHKTTTPLYANKNPQVI